MKYKDKSIATCVDVNFYGHVKCKLIIFVHVIDTNNYLMQSVNTAHTAASMSSPPILCHPINSYPPLFKTLSLNPFKGTMHAQQEEIISPL